MTTKGIDFKSIARDIGIIAGFVGAIASGAMITGSAPTSTQASPQIEQKLQVHTATDSVRWIYMESRIERMDRKLDLVIEQTK